MNIKIIDEKEQFAQCETFEITHLLWGTKAIPKTYGKIACWKEHGFLVEMTCEEADPLRTYIKMNDPVSLDSGMEAFLGFWSEETPLYVNVEMNANGATLMQYGTERTDRTFFTEEQIRFHKLPVQKLPVTFTKCVKAVMPNRFIMQVIRR